MKELNTLLTLLSGNVETWTAEVLPQFYLKVHFPKEVVGGEWSFFFFLTSECFATEKKSF